MAAGNLKVVTVNTVDQVGILYPRDAYHRRAKIGSAYLEVRMGMFFTFVPSGNDDAHCVAETIAPAGYLDWFTFGLKDSSANAPGKAGAQFIGHCWSADAVPANTNALTANTAGQASMANGGGKQLLATLNGATVISSGDSSVIMYFPVWSATNVNAFWGMRFLVANLGLSTQTVACKGQLIAAAQTDVSNSALRTAIYNTAYSGTERTLNWFSGNAALPLPDYVWIRVPFNNNRLRITNLACYKIG